jgi:UDP-4-amino-4,6-dideoxy-N-acetyl-beta-L-altrosamine transaminase
MIPYGRQTISDTDVQSVAKVLLSQFLTQGPAVPAFEEAIGQAVGSEHTVAVSSATAALHLAYLASDLGPGDVVWTSPITFVATANAALYCGASVDFVDIETDTFNLSPSALEEKLRVAETQGRLPKLVVPVHLAGQPCDMERISSLAEQYGFSVIEDASHSIGSSVGGTPTGSCKHSLATIFSFHPVKIVTTGEGGAITTNDEQLAERVRLLRSHGITRDPNEMSDQQKPPWYYEQIDLGFNYRMTDIQAALGTSQLQKLDSFIERRRELADRYSALLDPELVRLPHLRAGFLSSWHLYVIRSRKRDQLFEVLRERQISSNVHYIPVYRQPYYQRYGIKSEDFPNSEEYFRTALSLPLFPSLTERQQDEIVDIIRNVSE